MARTTQSSVRSTKAPSDMQSQTTDASDEKPFDPTRSKDEAKIYADAEEANRIRDFEAAIVASRTPLPVPEYIPPKPAPAILEQTRLEMEAGKKRVAEFAAEEATRREIHEANKRDKWADKGSVEIFRPADYVPDQRKGQGNVGGTSTDV